MFTGIIESVGTLAGVAARGDSLRMTVAAGAMAAGVRAGDSVCVNGICLTAVADGQAGRIAFDAVRETLARTTAVEWSVGRRLHLEQALTPSARMGGHIVQGHVDGRATLRRVVEQRTGREIHLEGDRDYLAYIVAKGSVAVDGVSLTVAGIEGDIFRIALVPFTLEHTGLGGLRAGDQVNIETDVLGRYVERLLAHGRIAAEGGGLTADLLRRSGFGGGRG
ncbi:MAG: riboflavin synthase [Planctomycetota bacterium]